MVKQSHLSRRGTLSKSERKLLGDYFNAQLRIWGGQGGAASAMLVGSVGVDRQTSKAPTSGETSEVGQNEIMKRTILPIKTNVRPVGFPPVVETLPGAIERIVSKLKPEKIILFGSYAYGTPTPDSDVDLLVIMKTKAREIDRYVAVSNLPYPRQFPVDILVKTPQRN